MKNFLVIFFVAVMITLFVAVNIGNATKLTASDGAYADYFGYSVSIDGDYAIVGAFYDDDNGISSGSAYIYHYNGLTWTQQAKLTASDATLGHNFGYSVSIVGDHAIVGAYHDHDNASDSGAAYIFGYDGTTWAEQAKLKASDADYGDWFGYSVSIDGDYAIVGAHYDDDNASDSGAAYIFGYDGTTWAEQDKLTASDGAYADRFGSSVSIDGDHAIVGAFYDDDNGFNSGSAYIFGYDGTTWAEQDKLIASDGADMDYFGASVSIDGGNAIVGAHQDSDNGLTSGSAYVFGYDGTTWAEQAKLTAFDGAAGDVFGRSVSIDGGHAIVGAFGDDDNGDGSGSAYIFGYDGTTWAEQTKLTAFDGAAEDYFGWSVAIGGGHAIVGAYRDDDNGLYSG